MVMRTYGLSGSGIDVDQMVKNIMEAQRTRYNTLAQKKTQIEWKKEDYNTIYTDINSFRDNTVFNYKLEGTLMPKKAEATNDSVLTAKANADAATFNHNVKVTAIAQSASMTSSGAISDGSTSKATLADHLGITGVINLEISDGTTTKSLSDYDTTDKSIYDLVSDINKLGLNVKATYDSNLDRFFLSATKTGVDTQITLNSSDAAGTGAHLLVNKLKLGADANNLSTSNAAANFTKGANAAVQIDGITLEQTSNTFTVAGVTYNLKKEGETNVTVAGDIDATISAVKSFVESYNKILSELNGKVNEKYYRDYLPLTDDQKAAMEDSDIEKWQAFARSGLLRRDSTLTSLINSMRSSIASPVSGLSGDYKTASSIGITTGDYSENGKLYLNETELRKALEEDPEIVNKIFGRTGDSYSQQGIAVRLYDSLNTASENLKEIAGTTPKEDTTSTLGKEIGDYADRLYALNERLNDMEDRYYAQFNAMELALSKLSQQSSWLAQQFSS
ncbi:hypothetical protein P22_0498 [Propionispora sp. 2/2-37]|uniref:flagellar filament capping protein FliD n=1 Tax=Propionispora sp. 2/2-37 TaxID=1677858 RepID=UPI0006BB69A9|nr:flagellar filament capping protein FliD [Propionispora sp. 2/2-37]CUH94432.1 hypothetical protein P22_0498 [Propionispora sp. 2/2-37]